MKSNTKQKFISIIQEQKILYKELLQTAKSENKLLESRKVDGLEDLLKNEEEIILKISDKEKEKYDVFLIMAKETGFDNTETIKIEDVLKKAEKNDADEILKELEDFMSVVRDTETLNMTNSHLIKNYLGVLNFSKELAEKAKTPANLKVYDSKGVAKVKKEEERKGFDSKI